MAFLGISTTYGNVAPEDVINDKTKIDSNQDVLGANYSLAQMEVIKTELNDTISTLQTQVNEQAVKLAFLEEKLTNLTTPPL